MDWPHFTKRLLLADGRISEIKAEMLQHAVMSEGAIDKEELEFLTCLKRQASWVHPTFDEFLFRVLRKVILRDGEIHDSEARWLRKLLFADRQIVPAEQEFIVQLKKDARTYGPEFEKLYRECMQLNSSEFSD